MRVLQLKSLFDNSDLALVSCSKSEIEVSDEEFASIAEQAYLDDELDNLPELYPDKGISRIFVTEHIVDDLTKIYE